MFFLAWEIYVLYTSIFDKGYVSVATNTEQVFMVQLQNHGLFYAKKPFMNCFVYAIPFSLLNIYAGYRDGSIICSPLLN